MTPFSKLVYVFSLATIMEVEISGNPETSRPVKEFSGLYFIPCFSTFGLLQSISVPSLGDFFIFQPSK
jgi:hypothetical protein